MVRLNSDFWALFAGARQSHAEGRNDEALEELEQAARVALRQDAPTTEARLRLLRQFAAVIDPDFNLDASLVPQPEKTPLRVVVSGIGRSGTTLLYQQIAKALLLSKLKTNFRYEPYLWDINTPAVKGNPFGMAQMSPFGIHVHTTSPLFLDRPDALHDTFCDGLFAGAWDGDPEVAAEAYLTKVIRGSGRLRAYIEKYPDLKILANLRNPLDTLNSSLGMFSFLGEEFHFDDRPRFARALEARGIRPPSEALGPLSVEWSAAWWRAFTQETLDVAADYPDNVLPFCYEQFSEDPAGMLGRVKDFVGIDNPGMSFGLSRPAGLRIKKVSLTRHDLAVLKDDMDFYVGEVLEAQMDKAAVQGRVDKIVSRFAEGEFSFPVAGSKLGTKTPVQLRGIVLQTGGDAFSRFIANRAHPLDSTGRPPVELDSTKYDPKTPRILRPSGRPRFGAIVTCYNNAATIADAVLSCLNQTRPFDEIVVVDDKSTDPSLAILRELEAMYSSVRVLPLRRNSGPSAARHLGFHALTTDYVTQLDGDDRYWPTKNEAEAEAVAGEMGRIAFSDILLVTKERDLVRDTQAYDDRDGQGVFRAMLARTPQIPRDMTFDRALYTAAGGYNLMLHLYEDWDLKLRLAAGKGKWVRAGGPVGTVYNRITPGLSGQGDPQHAQALMLIFLRALGFRDVDLATLDHDEVLAAYDKALGRFGERHLAKVGRAALALALERGPHAVHELAGLVSTRRFFAAPIADQTESLNTFIENNRKAGRQEQKW